MNPGPLPVGARSTSVGAARPSLSGAITAARPCLRNASLEQHWDRDGTPGVFRAASWPEAGTSLLPKLWVSITATHSLEKQPDSEENRTTKACSRAHTFLGISSPVIDGSRLSHALARGTIFSRQDRNRSRAFG